MLVDNLTRGLITPGFFMSVCFPCCYDVMRGSGKEVQWQSFRCFEKPRRFFARVVLLGSLY
jgi:hypothetical protein